MGYSHLWYGLCEMVVKRLTIGLNDFHKTSIRMRLRYICGDEQLQAVINFSNDSLNIVYSSPLSPSGKADNRELFNAIGHVLDLAFKRNGVDISEEIINEINSSIYSLIFSGRANTFNVPIRPQICSPHFEAAYNFIEPYMAPNLV